MRATVCAALLALWGVTPVLAAKLPQPKAGAIPLELAQIASAEGPNLRLADAPLDLLGNRLRFEARIADLGRTASGESFVRFAAGDAELIVKLPGPLEDPGRLDHAKTWEVILRPDRRVTLADGRAAIAVTPDILIKTPAPPGEIHPGDLIVGVAGEDLFDDPGAAPWMAEEPLYRVRITKPGAGVFLRPAESAMAEEKDSLGRKTIDYRVNTGAEDGRKRAVRCLFRVEEGRLRNTAVGAVELSLAGEQLRHEWVDFERDRYHDTWSGRKKPFPKNTYAFECLGFALAGFPFSRTSVMRFYLWSGRGNPIPVYAFVDGEETVSARGGREPARVVRAGLDVRRVARDIDLPEEWRHAAEAVGESWHRNDSRYWISTRPPPVVLRFAGAFGAPGSAEGEIERVR